MSKNKINLIFFLPSFIKGGAAFSIYKLCKNLNQNLFKIHILCLGKCEIKNQLQNNQQSIYNQSKINQPSTQHQSKFNQK